jgi:hypothetical protein
MRRLIWPATSLRSPFKRPAPRHRWAEDSFKMILEWQLRGLREREHTMLRIGAGGHTKVCRMASPAQDAPLSVGDSVELHGREHGDGILRVFRLYNLTTQSTYRPSFLAPQALPLLLFSAVFVVLFLDFLISLSAT